MAVELCSDNSGMSPRISFSHDLCHFDVVPVEQRPLRSKSSHSNSNSSMEFDFCVHENSIEQESSSADELFSNGKILPTEIKKINNNNNVPAKHPFPEQNSIPENSNPNKNSKTKNKIMQDETADDVVVVDDQIQKQSFSSSSSSSSKSSSSFWGFKRSSSCGSGYSRSLCPLPLLSRSYSTGSTPNVKQNSISKDSQSHKQINNSHKHAKYSSTSNYQKPPLRKSYNKPYGNGGVQVNPVLNVPSGNLFGLGSIFFNGKDKNHRKKSLI